MESACPSRCNGIGGHVRGQCSGADDALRLNGERFSYSTADRAQAQVARQRLHAAKAAAAARARADAELAANPLVRLFGSDLQTEAKAAEAQLAGTLENSAGTPALPPITSTAKKQPRTVTRRARGDGVPATSTPSVSVPRGPPTRTRGMTTGSVRPPRPDADPGHASSSPKVALIIFDFASGIKTVHRADGSIEEDSFEPAAAAKLSAGDDRAFRKLDS